MRKSISAWKTGKKIGSEAALVLLACASDVNGKDYLVSTRYGSYFTYKFSRIHVHIVGKVYP